MKKILPLLIVIGLFLIGYFSTSIIINKNRKEYKKNNSSIEPIIITTYSKVNGNKIAVVKITDEKEIEKFLSMTKDIVILDGPMAVSLFVITEVKVSYKNLRIYTQKDYEYCYYRAENSNESPLAMMSSDLVNFIKKYTNDIG